MKKKAFIYLSLGLLAMVWLGNLGFKTSGLEKVIPQQNYMPPQEITVTMYVLRPGGTKTDIKCTVDDPATPEDEADKRYGCQPDVESNSGLSYPYTSNPVTISIEGDYLL